MKNLCFFLLSFALMACTLTVSRTIETDMFDFSTELTEVLRPAFAAYKLVDFFNSTLSKPSGQLCWVCTILMATMEKYVVLKNITIDDFVMNDICPRVPVLYRSTCQEIVNQYGPTIINTLIETESPDAACTAINYCDYPQCKLYPKGEEPKVSFSPDWVQYFQFEKPQFEAPSIEMIDRLYTRLMLDTISSHENSKLATWVESLTQAGENPLDLLKELLKKLAKNHTAIVDLDGDFFSQTSAELRGYNWRGRDCDDTNLNIHPGRKTDPKPGFFDDYNCNGIHGVDPATSQDYKDELCGNSGQLGVVVMGDSAGAHCEVPVQWVNASAWDYYTFDDLIQSLSNELDLPHMSGYTGYADTGYTGPVSSVYKYMFQRNKCNFRDYLNIAVNGLASGNAHQAIIRLGRSQTDDYPVLVFLELIGNDVCDRRNTTDAFTTVDEFRTNLIGILDILDTLLPAGSHLVALGLANGSLIFEAVNGRMHPAGVTYNQFYDFQNCVEGSLCWGWLNTNESVRDETTQRAVELSQVYSEVFSNYTAQNYDFIYYDFPTDQVFANYTAMGKDTYELIEPVDGFHPSQVFHAMLGDYLWSSLLRDRPDWLGPENPNNDRITQLFGDQGGY